MSCKWPVKYPHSFKKLMQDPNSKPAADWISLGIELKKKYSKLKIIYPGKSNKSHY
jgi:hypothetical protein